MRKEVKPLPLQPETRVWDSLNSECDNNCQKNNDEGREDGREKTFCQVLSVAFAIVFLPVHDKGIASPFDIVPPSFPASNCACSNFQQELGLNTKNVLPPFSALLIGNFVYCTCYLETGNTNLFLLENRDTAPISVDSSGIPTPKGIRRGSRERNVNFVLNKT